MQVVLLKRKKHIYVQLAWMGYNFSSVYQSVACKEVGK